MAFWIELNPGAGGDLLAADFVATLKYQITKIGFSDAGAVPVQVSAGDPLPVSAVFESSLPTGTNIIGAVLQAGTWNINQAGVWQVNPGNVQNTVPWLVTESPSPTTGSSNEFSYLSPGGVPLVANIKPTAGTIYSVQCFNLGIVPLFVRLYDIAGVPDGTQTPIWRGIVPGNSGATGFSVQFLNGIQTVAGIAVRATAQVADPDNSALPANTLMVNVEWL